MDALGPYYPLIMPPLLLAVAYLLSALIPESLRPRAYLLTLAQGLADKTNKLDRSSAQRRLAGALAGLTLCVPLLLVLYMATRLAAYPQLLDVIMLAWLMPGRALNQDIMAMARYLHQGNKASACGILNNWALRDTDKLTQLGITKAGIEVQLQYSQNHVFALICWYMIAGPIAALLVWLVNELTRIWHPKREQFCEFGYWLERLAHLLMLPVNFSMALALALCKSPLKVWQARKQLGRNQLELLAFWPQFSLANSLERQLGGPWLLEGNKHHTPKLGPCTAVTPVDLLHSQRLLNFATWLWLALLFIIGASIALLGHQLP